MLRYLALICFSGAFVSAVEWDFSPLAPKVDVYSPVVPVAFIPSQTQLLNGSITGSYWSSSFVTDTSDKQYLVISYTVLQSIHGSILDINELSHTSFSSALTNITSVSPTNNELYLSSYNSTFEALTPDNFYELRTTTAYTNTALDTIMGFNLTWTADQPILGRTSGSLVINDKEVTIDPSRSSTWYDRQWGPGIPTTGNWTWFEMHLPNDVKASVWAWDNASPPQRARFATILYSSGQTRIVPIEWKPNESKTWTSPVSGHVYPQEWDIVFLGGTSEGGRLKVTSVLGPQEIGAFEVEQSLFTYEGFARITGSFENEIVDWKAFSVVEMQYFT